MPIATLSLLIAAALPAQEAPSSAPGATPAPGPSPTASPAIPSIEFDLPGRTTVPAPATPVPQVAPPPVGPTVDPRTETARPKATPTPEAQAEDAQPDEPAATPTPGAGDPTPVPSVAPSPAIALPTPIPTASPPPAPVPQAQASSAWLSWWPAAALLAAALLGWTLLRRRRRATGLAESDEDQPIPAAAPPPAPSVPAGPLIDVTLTPRKAGLTAIELVVDFEVHVRNRGATTIGGILASVHLLSAWAGQDGEIAAIAAEPTDPSGHNPFALPAGADRVLKARLVLPRGMVRTTEVRGRPIAVPIVVVDLRWGSDQLTQAFMVGRPLEGSDRLGPFFPDRPFGLSADVAARRYDWRPPQ